jgi:arginase family enzyme
MRSYEMSEIVSRGLDECLTESFGIAVDDCEGVFLSVDIDVCDPAHAPGRRGSRGGRCSMAGRPGRRMARPRRG